ncbi:hypothetical protein K2Q00_02705 [Patescibacteria group bacterium]|nr:hypothetical protein [Patescibacteria group bacterium]
MKRESWLVAVVCAFGALIGSLGGLELSTYWSPTLRWWCAAVGMLSGGIVAYVTIDFRQFCAGVADSWRATITWQPNRAYWRTYMACWVGMSAACATSILGLGVALVSVGFLDRTAGISMDGIVWGAFYGVFCFWPAASLTFGTWASFESLRRPAEMTDSEYEDRLRCAETMYWEMARDGNPVNVIYLGLKGLWWLVKLSPTIIGAISSFLDVAMMSASKFIAATFIRVHSSRRAICFVAAGLGALLGFGLGNFVAGTLIGAGLGFVLHELIAVRWLKLAVRR